MKLKLSEKVALACFGGYTLFFLCAIGTTGLLANFCMGLGLLFLLISLLTIKMEE